MKITNAEINVIRFSSEDVIATSGMLGPLSGSTGLFYMRGSEYPGYTGSSDWVSFNGIYGNYSGGQYVVNTPWAFSENGSDELDALAYFADHPEATGYYNADVGIAVPKSFYQNTAKQTTFATSSGGTIYSTGLSYYDQYWQ